MKKFSTTHIGQKIPSLTNLKFESHYSHISQKAPQTDYKSVFFWQSWGNCNIEAHSWRGVFNGPGKVGSVTERQHLLRKGKSGCRSCRKPSPGKPTLSFVWHPHLSPSWMWEPCSQLHLPRETEKYVLEDFCYYAAIKTRIQLSSFPFALRLGLLNHL